MLLDDSVDNKGGENGFYIAAELHNPCLTN